MVSPKFLRSWTSLFRSLDIGAEKQTKKIIRLTWALIALTFALLVFTAYLAEDAYFKGNSEQAKQNHESKHP